MRKIKKALISVHDKQNLKPLLSILKKNKVEIISSGGTYKFIKKLNFKCAEISEFTGSSEILGGRVKTLHPKIHAGILNIRENKSHIRDLRKNNFENIDLVIVNFYPFEKTLENSSNHNTIIENIDVGGPTLVRSAAKNYNDVTVITNCNQYNELIDELVRFKGATSLNFRKKMSEIAFTETSYYDAVISNYFQNLSNNILPKKKIIYGNLIEKLRYGENPHQKSAIYSKNSSINIKQLSGKQLSFNNYNDIFTAIKISKSLPKNRGVVIVKHANPCGVSIIKDSIECYKSALACDPISAFGGIISCNFKINKRLALELSKLFLEVVIGNNFEASALKILKKKKNLRLIDASNFKPTENLELNSNNENILVQSADIQKFTKNNFKIVSKNKPTKTQLENLIFAFNICRHVKSNAIVLASNKSTFGIGSGQPSRLDSCKIAIKKMKKFSLKSNDLVAASDAFFPFVDGIEKLIQSGVTAIIQPAGSIKDKEIVKFANQTNTVLLFSKTRHFKH
ncbi:bifunctional phosphoribosylaminoimidazolecarboxamide formyltransferase/IMP cyclohydrolase [Candidatus Pelagibacter communis]|uniref:bifunctional phosphoribosylaminoimidazolecarboxamide formyltransferase/IMP cyclohydrolase n=1 Tax=Pelagibacter ubique TaxID=198252 RepID=UPI00094CE662|nr:bifunctional phosphoribosylaminoimidazolecarboxamide formyltransferase/IMP cyclohydrolase [Candidatus Pelagibacter ubique]|tara:strand:- start:7358 stop:8893 length:1536 start_codon:yes stop_codon:yes gene_type:complete